MTSSPSPPRRILMVNYHTDTNRIMTRLLQRYGYEATAAETLAAARQLLNDIRFDVLLCRNTAADGEPADFITETKSRFPTMPIIAFGGGLNEQRIQELQQAGANDCLYIPFDMNQLLQLLGKYQNHR